MWQSSNDNLQTSHYLIKMIGGIQEIMQIKIVIHVLFFRVHVGRLAKKVWSKSVKVKKKTKKKKPRNSLTLNFLPLWNNQEGMFFLDFKISLSNHRFLFFFIRDLLSCLLYDRRNEKKVHESANNRPSTINRIKNPGLQESIKTNMGPFTQKMSIVKNKLQQYVPKGM